MTEPRELKKRDPVYSERLLGFQDAEPVKVITGIRWCGKSSPAETDDSSSEGKRRARSRL